MADTAFDAARDRFVALRRELARGPAWSADGRAVTWSRDGEDIALDPADLEISRTAPDAAPPTEAPEQPRAFLCEAYLVPEFPMPEARSPEGMRFASIRGGELLVRSARDDSGHPLTSGATDAVAWDLETVGVDPWSPDGRLLYACRMDRTLVERRPRTRFAADGTVSIDHPRSQRTGTPIDVPHPHVVPASGGAPRPIDLGDTRDHFVRLVGWLPDGRSLVLARFSRLLDRADLFEADAESGAARCFLSETSPTFLRNSTIVWTEPVGCWLLEDRRFAWLSARNGWTHLYAGRLDTSGLQRLTDGPLTVHAVLRHDRDRIWFTASRDGPRPYDRHLFGVALDGGPVDQLTRGDGEHDVRFSPDGTMFLDTSSTPEQPPRTLLCRADGSELTDLGGIDPAALLGTGWHAPEEIVTVAADGETALHGVLYRPDGLNPDRRYPLVHWLYGGPQIVSAPHRFGPANDNHVLFHALAAAGIAVFVIDARGTPGRSKAFQDVVWRSFVDHVVADQVAALRQLVEKHAWIDARRVGTMGRSWGAHFALRLIARAPDLYRAGVLVVPGLDPYGGLIYEPYLGLPRDDPAPYRAAEPWALPAELAPDTRLLLMAGTLDSPCQWDMQRLSTLLVEAEIRHSLVTFAEQEHVFEGAALRFHDRAVHDFLAEALA